MLLPTALVAQPSSVFFPKDSLHILRHTDSVVQNAPFIFKAEIINEKAVRGEKDEVIAVGQLRVIEVVKGNITVGDTVEYSYSQGFAYWNPNGSYDFPIHSSHLDVYWGGAYNPIYYFAKTVTSKPYFEKSKKAFVLFSEKPFSICSYDYFGLAFGHVKFDTEALYFNYINKLLTPKEVVKPKQTQEKKYRFKKSKVERQEIQWAR